MSRSAPLAVTALLAPPVVLALVATQVQAETTAWPLAQLVILALFVLGSLAPRFPRACVALAAGLSVVPTAELVLRLVGVGDAGGTRVHFGWPRPAQLHELAPDPQIFWTLAPNKDGVNPKGYAGPEVERPKPAGRLRVVLSGDSVTQYGLGTALCDVLRDDGVDADCVNLGVVGHTAWQGQRRLERRLVGLQPDIVVIGFGWNDHWRTWSAPDPELATHATRPGTWLHTGWSSVRLLQLRTVHPTMGPTRLSESDFDDALMGLLESARSHEARPVLWTLPSSHQTLGVPDYLVSEGLVASADEATASHSRYAERIRVQAQAESVHLADLLAEPLSPAEATARFEADGIHLTDAGRTWAAEALSEQVRAVRP